MKKAAVLVGINKYPDGRLWGCVNDITERYKRLVDVYKFPADNIHVLLDERATKANIITRLRWLIRFGNQAGAEGSKLVFYYSGHGTQFRDWTDTELNDHLDEALCPVDYDFARGSDTFILDDELKRLFADLPQTAELTTVLDSCHSGTGTRGIGVNRGHRRKFVTPPLDVAMRHKDRTLPSRKLGSSWLNVLPDLNHLLLAACKDDQTAADSTFGVTLPVPHGALSWALMQSEDKGAGRTWLQVVEDLRKVIAEEGFSQSPQLEGAAARINGYPF